MKTNLYQKLGAGVLLLTLGGGLALYLAVGQGQPVSEVGVVVQPSPTPTQLIQKTIDFKKPGLTELIPMKKHVFQTFNNCGPAALSMALSYYGIEMSQAELGQKLRPYQNSLGDNDDKSVNLDEFAIEASKHSLTTFHRPNGRLELIKTLVANGVPIIVRTWLNPNDDIGHFRIIRGFNDSTRKITQDDSYHGKDLQIDYNEFFSMWQPFGYEYLLLLKPDQKELVAAILGEEENEKQAWENAKSRSLEELSKNSSDPYTLFNLSTAHYQLGNYDDSVKYFEQVESKLPFRMLWYQIQPIRSYQKLKNYPRVFGLTNKILNNYNRAFSELYQIRGEVYLEQGNRGAAKVEFEKAVLYNSNFQPAKEALTQLN